MSDINIFFDGFSHLSQIATSLPFKEIVIRDLNSIKILGCKYLVAYN